MSEIKESSGKIESLIQEVVLTYRQKYNVEFTKDVHIIVGAYGSNAFTHRQIIPEVTFCLEKLSSDDKHLKVIIAHEFGHTLHNILSDQEGWIGLKFSGFIPLQRCFRKDVQRIFQNKLLMLTNRSIFIRR